MTLYRKVNCKLIMPLILALVSLNNALAQKTDHAEIDLVIGSDSILDVSVDYKILELENDTTFFLLFPGAQNLKIEADGLIGQSIGQKPDRPFPFHLLLFKPGNIGQPKSVRFSYQINLASMNHLQSDWIELNVDKLWIPKHKDADNQFTFNAHVNNELKNYSFISYTLDKGEFKPIIFENAGEFELSVLEPTLEVFLMGGANMISWANENDQTPISIFANQNTTVEVLTTFSQSVKTSIEFYNQQFGANDRINSYQVILRNTKPNEINYLQARGAILLGNSFASDLASVSHEVSHYWWSGADFINEPWMNESFANFSMMVLLQNYDKPSFSEQLERMKRGAASAGSVLSARAFDSNGFPTYYYKGTVILLELDEKIGRDKMLTLLEQRVSRGIKKASEWLALVKEIAGEETMLWHKSQLD